jgi:DNA polymerase-3 subunit delta'
MASGGSKAIKELEKEQKSRATRFVRDTIDGALLDLATLYRDVMMVQAGVTDSLINSDLTDDISRLAAKIPPAATITKINAIMSARTNLSHNAAPLLTLEALFCSLA